MDLTHDELAWCLKKEFPGTEHFKDYSVAMYVDPDTNLPSGMAFIATWHLDVPQPTVVDILFYAEKYKDVILAQRAKDERLGKFKPLSPRSLWLAALGLGIEKQDVLDTVAALEDEDLRKRYTIELTEPPSTGYYRDSESMEHIRELMGIPADQFDDVWLWAQEG